MGQIGHIKSEYGYYIYVRVYVCAYCLPIVIDEVSDTRSHYSVQFSREFIRIVAPWQRTEAPFVATEAPFLIHNKNL